MEGITKGMGKQHAHAECGSVEEVIGSYARGQIRHRARLVAGAHGLNESDREDLESELVARIWRMLPSHAPDKASLQTFVSMVITNGISAFIRHSDADCRNRRREEFSLDETIVEDGEEIRRADAIPARDTGRVDIDAILDVRQVLADLPPHLGKLCEMMKARSLLAISRETGISRHTLRKWLDEVRQIFKSKGLDAYLPKERSAVSK